MQDLLQTQKTFKISSPLNPSREIVFGDPFEDIEFDAYIATNDSLILKIDKKTVCRLKFLKDHLVGTDTRGGETILTPKSENKDKFIRYFKPNHRVEVLIPEKEDVPLEGKIAIVTPFKFEGYTCVNPKRERLFKIYDDLFSKGYDYVFHIDCSTTKGFIPLLTTLSKQYLTGERIGSVQVCSHKTSDDGSAISFEDGDWRGFSIDKKTWTKIKAKVMTKQLNFYRALTVQFREKKLFRISTDMSRDKFSTPQDKNRKNFIGI